MRKVIVLATFLFISSVSLAQGNLQFNQVLTFAGQMNSTTYSSTIYTVPSGKVWKVECKTKAIGGASEPKLFINSVPVDGNNQYGQPTGNIDNNNIIWLKAGDQIYYQGYSSYGFNYFLSIIEFNIVQ